jgi:hypothetical protein
MLSTPTRAQQGCEQIQQRLTEAIQRHDREEAREIYYSQVLPNPAIDRREAVRWSYRVGAIDEGDQHVAAREDL